MYVTKCLTVSNKSQNNYNAVFTMHSSLHKPCMNPAKALVDYSLFYHQGVLST